MKQSPAREKTRPILEPLMSGLETVLRGKTSKLELAVMTLLAGGHLLIEDVPGVGKTTLAQGIARLFAGDFRRVQFTSDLLPTDILGLTLYNQSSREFEFKRGPIFTNCLLADEINRATPKTQGALLEAMAQGQVSIDGVRHELPRPFFVVATQNPIEHHGTFPLPKSQEDRFLMRLTLGYPDHDDEVAVLRDMKHAFAADTLEPAFAARDVVQMQAAVMAVHMEDSLLDYIRRIAQATRTSNEVELGLSTRGAIALRRASQAHAYYFSRDFVVPDDIKAVAPFVLAHRLQLIETFDNRLAPGRERDDERFVRRLIETVDVPV